PQTPTSTPPSALRSEVIGVHGGITLSTIPSRLWIHSGFAKVIFWAMVFSTEPVEESKVACTVHILPLRSSKGNFALATKRPVPGEGSKRFTCREAISAPSLDTKTSFAFIPEQSLPFRV